MKPLPPAIKWSGSKRSLAPHLSLLVAPAPRFFDPFVGGGSILPFRKSEESYAGDTVAELIGLWKLIGSEPDALLQHYARLWRRLQDEGHTVYYEVRARFNEERDPRDLFFLSRTCVNGLIRFNASGEFNNSLHHTRPGIAPTGAEAILLSWSKAIRGVGFYAQDYRETLAPASKGDLAFLDPPYAATRGRYHPTRFDAEGFYGALEDLNRRGVRWILTYDGHAGSRSYTSGLPDDLWRHRFKAPSGRSPFTRLMKTSLDTVFESIYVNFDPPAEVVSHLNQLARESLGDRPETHVEQDSLFAA